MDNYNVSTKFNGKWKAFGKIKPNQYGNMQLSFKVTDELKQLIANSNGYLNFSLFADEPRQEKQEATFDDPNYIPF